MSFNGKRFCLIFSLQERLINVRSELINRRYGLGEVLEPSNSAADNVRAGYIFPPRQSNKVISADELIIGALEASFFDMVRQSTLCFTKLFQNFLLVISLRDL